MRHQATISLAALAVLASGAQPSGAEAPPLPCVGMEGGMVTYELAALDPESAKSGVTLEHYQVDMAPDASGTYKAVPAPVPDLQGFFGVRVMHCASGTFFAIRTDQRPATVAASLAATEFLRAQVQAGQRVGQPDLAEAIRAVYGASIRLRETEETCGCHAVWPELRPGRMRAYPDRTDTKH